MQVTEEPELRIVDKVLINDDPKKKNSKDDKRENQNLKVKPKKKNLKDEPKKKI